MNSNPLRWLEHLYASAFRTVLESSGESIAHVQRLSDDEDADLVVIGDTTVDTMVLASILVELSDTRFLRLTGIGGAGLLTYALLSGQKGLFVFFGVTFLVASNVPSALAVWIIRRRSRLLRFTGARELDQR